MCSESTKRAEDRMTLDDPSTPELIQRWRCFCQVAPLYRPGWIWQLSRDEAMNPVPVITKRLQFSRRRSHRPSPSLPTLSNLGGVSKSFPFYAKKFYILEKISLVPSIKLQSIPENPGRQRHP